MERHERAWAAGFFDGDGWAGSVRNRNGRRPAARVNQSGEHLPVVLERFHRAVEGRGSLGGPYESRGRRNLYCWVASSAVDVSAVGTSLWPWLTERRRRQFEAAVGAICPFELDVDEDDSKWWAAGLFDAEGSVSLSSHRTHQGYFIGEAAVTQGSPGGLPTELTRFQEAIGGAGRIYGPFVQKAARLSIYRWKAHRLQDLCALAGVLRPRLSATKGERLDGALAVLSAQPRLPRGNPAWGAYKTHCINGHEYATVRIRRYVSRGANTPARDSHQCLECMRERARARRWRIGDGAEDRPG